VNKLSKFGSKVLEGFSIPRHNAINALAKNP